jgi:hypothetical protein
MVEANKSHTFDENVLSGLQGMDDRLDPAALPLL